MNDRSLVEALRSGAPEAPGALYDSYGRRLYEYCWFRLGDHEAAQAALCDAFIVAEAHIRRLQSPDRLGAWLYALVRRECTRLAAEGAAGDGPAPPFPGKDRGGRGETDQRIIAWRAVWGMPLLSREVLELQTLHRLPMPELASVLGLPDQDVRALLARAAADLEESLAAD